MKKNIIQLILLCLIYTPIFLITLLIIIFSGIDYSCRFTDLNCIFTHKENLIDYIILYGVNLTLLIPIIITVKNLIKNKKKEGE